MSLMDSLLLSIFGMAVVFIVLVALSLLLRAQSGLITFFTGRKAKKAPASEAAALQPAEEAAEKEAPEPQKIAGGEVSLNEEKKQEPIKTYEKQKTAVSYRVIGEPVKKFTAVINGKIFTAEIEEIADAGEEAIDFQRLPAVSAKPVPVKPELKAEAPEKKTHEPPKAAGSAEAEVITAAVPGTVLDIKVEVGAKVKRGDVLMLLEAMKMENEIVAAKDGTIVKIMTSKGAAVTMGMPLIEIQ